jgi:2-keto-4-pentenoate hydratase/2-oxohepta-3-ene-1,7-dioic acid hydratase in catechol pathway
MRFVRFESQGQIQYGQLDGDRVIALEGDILGRWKTIETSFPLAGVRLLAPVQPRQILAVGLNYRSHLQGRPEPQKPEMFWKPASAVIGPDEAIVLPSDATNAHPEGELVVVIGQRASHVSVQDAARCVLGYSIGNDVSERNWQEGDRQWWRAKGCDTFAPMGPWIETELNLAEATLTTRMNDEVVQEGKLGELIFGVPEVISFVSRYVTLEPGDVIYTGTPGHTRAMSPGDRVDIEVTGLGVLSNSVMG